MGTAKPQMAKKTQGPLRGGRALLKPPPGLRRADMIAVGCIMVSCFFLFQTGDMDITSSLSYAYLDGHFFDFYRYNKAGIASAFAINIDYLQPLFLLFALWNLPLKLFGLTDHAAQGIYKLSAPELAWTKLLLVVFLALCSVTVYKIARLIAQDDDPAKLCMFLFASNPLAIYAIYIFGGYDIFGLTFMMLGLHAFLQHRHWRFILWFALALPFKYYALIAFLPLLLLGEKKVWKLLRDLLAVSVPTLVCLVLSRLDQGSTPLKRLDQAVSVVLNLGGTMRPGLLVLAYLIVCLFAYCKRAGDERELQKYAVFLPLAAFSALFFCIFWYPQWLILATPWLALAFLFSPNRTYSLLFEAAGSAALIMRIFSIYTTFQPPEGGNFWVDPAKFDLENVQYYLGNFWVTFPRGYGPVRGFFQPGLYSIGSLIPRTLHPYVDVISFVCMLSPFLLQYMYRKKDTWPLPKLFKTEAIPLRLRTYGSLAVYLLPIAAVSAGYVWFPDLMEKMKAAVLQFGR